jgi:hypothetical protein
MIKLISLGLMGLAAFRVMAFCFAYKDELPPAREKSVLALVNDADNDSSMIETGVAIPWFLGTVGKQQKTPWASLLQATSPAHTGTIAICGSSVQSDPGQVEAFHG